MSRQIGIPPKVREYVFSRDGWHCRHCNNSNGIDPHHVIFRSKGGGDVANNLIALCRKCHNDIHDRRLIIEIVETKEHDIIVKFWRQKGWKP